MQKNLLASWNIIRGKLRKAKRIIMFFDYDGTLTPYTPRPELAVADQKLGT